MHSNIIRNDLEL